MDAMEEIAEESANELFCYDPERWHKNKAIILRAMQQAVEAAQKDTEKPERMFGEHIRETIEAFKPLFKK